MVRKSLIAAFMAVSVTGSAMANAEFEPNYSSDLQGFPSFWYGVEACDSNGQQIQLNVAFDISGKDRIDSIYRLSPSLPKPTDGKDLGLYFYDGLSFKDRVEATEKYEEHFANLLKRHAQELASANPISEQKRATLLEDDFYVAFPKLSENLATISRKIGKTEGWRNITGAFVDVMVTPSAEYCSGNPAPRVMEVKP